MKPLELDTIQREKLGPEFLLMWDSLRPEDRPWIQVVERVDLTAEQIHRLSRVPTWDTSSDA